MLHCVGLFCFNIQHECFHNNSYLPPPHKKGTLSKDTVTIQEKGGGMLHTGNTLTELWVDLLQEASGRAKTKLTENQESYLVFMLMRFIGRCELSGITLSLKYLESTLESRRVQEVKLADTADAGLLFAGLFPERSRRLNVSSSYFMEMSRICFFNLADLCEMMKHQGESMLYRDIAENVEKLTYVLSCTRTSKIALQELSQITRQGTLQ